MSTPTDVLRQLNSARDIVLRDAAIYPQVVPGVLPVIAATAHLELRRWGADFLAETFASPVLGAEEKQKMCIGVLDTLKSYLNRKDEVGEDEDSAVVKSTVQCAASIYPLVFRHTLSNTSDTQTWAKMASVKSSILRSMDTASAGVRICCIKFVARVVQVQTPGLIADPRRQDQNEISLALVPRDHPLIPPSNLEAEASGLLDRLLGVLQDNLSDALIVTATLNSLSILVQRRATISPKILTTVLNFNPLQLATRPIAGRDKVAIRSMTRTTMSFLLNILKRNPNHASAARLQQTVERLRLALQDVFSERDSKRSAPDEPIDGLDDHKRQKIEYETANGTHFQPPLYPALPASGPISYAQLFTLSHDPGATSFHVEAIPQQVVSRLVPAILNSIDPARLEEAINMVRKRYLELEKRPPASALAAARAVTGEDEDDDYDPSAAFPGSEQVFNQLDQLPPEGVDQDFAIGLFNLPAPPPLTDVERAEYSRSALTRVFGTLTELDRETRSKGGKKQEVEKGFNRLAASTQDREGWIKLITRLATRATFDRETGEHVHKQEEDKSIAKKGAHFDLATGIRQALMNYVMEDFRRRIDVAIAWLNEEWYSDRLVQRRRNADRHALPHYWHYALRVLDAMMPYLDVKDGRILIRFLSEIPELNRDVLDRVRRIALDPERVAISTQALLYLIMFRPPVRELAVDTAEQMWRENSDAKASAAKILVKWRPEVLAEVKKEGEVMTEP